MGTEEDTRSSNEAGTGKNDNDNHDGNKSETTDSAAVDSAPLALDKDGKEETKMEVEEANLPTLADGWTEHESAQGIMYYFNAGTGESRWVRPVKGAEEIEVSVRKGSLDNIEMGAIRKKRKFGGSDEVEQAVEELSEERKMLQSQLSSKDAILDPRIKELMSRWLVGDSDEPSSTKRKRGKNLERDSEHLIEMVSSGYEGFGEYVGLMMRWLDMLGGEKRPNLGEATATEHFKLLASKEFSPERVVQVLEDVSDEGPPKWLLGMLHSSNWRNLLISLADKHKANPLLDFCVKAICKAGLHAEVAEVMNTATYFAVFRRMFTDTLRGILEFDPTSPDNTIAQLSKLEERLRELSGFSQYTYLFVITALEYLEGGEEVGTKPADGQYGAEIEALKSLSAGSQAKIRRLRQGLENIPRKPNESSRLETVQLTNPINRRSENGLSASASSGGIPDLAACLRSFFTERTTYRPDVVSRIRQFYDPVGNQNHALMPTWPIRRMEFLMLLTQHLYDPYKPLTPEGLRDGAYILAIATARGSAKGVDFERKIWREIEESLDICKDKDTLTVTGLNPQSENMKRLEELVRTNPPVAAGVVLFARTLFLSPKFQTNSCFSIGMRSLLSLIRCSIRSHPLHRVMAFYTIRHALPISPININQSKLGEIKQLMIDELITLMECGFVFQVLEFIKQQATHLDQSLVRYFLVSLAKVAGSPMSPEFAKSALQVFNTEICSRCLRGIAKDSTLIVNDFKSRCQQVVAISLASTHSSTTSSENANISNKPHPSAPPPGSSGTGTKREHFKLVPYRP